MTILPGSPDVRGVAITSNRAYEPIKHKGRLEDEYDLVSPPESPPGVDVNVVPSPPPLSHQPLPAVPPPAATPPPENGGEEAGGEEAVYEHIPGDK